MGRAAFLLGAGVSLDAGMPSTSELTAKVLEGAVARGMESHYRLAPAQSPGPRNGSLDYIGLVMALVRELKTEVDAFYSGYPGRVANYEDIYYLAVQIADAMSGEYDNPALRLLIDRLAPILAPFFAPVQRGTTAEEMLMEAGNEAVRYIEDVVWQSLAGAPAGSSMMPPVLDAANDEGLDGLDVFTLNHDTVLERSLRSAGIPFADGFAERQGSVCPWDMALLRSSTARIRVVKLHGSVNWCYYGGLGLAKTVDGDMYHFTLTDGTIGKGWGPGHPTILCGTFNKMLEYLRGPFFDLHLLFREALDAVNLLVVSGCSFGDKGINNRLWEWMADNRGRRLVVVHENQEALVREARGMVQKNWESWKQAGKLIWIPKWFEAVTWAEIKERIAAS